MTWLLSSLFLCLPSQRTIPRLRFRHVTRRRRASNFQTICKLQAASCASCEIWQFLSNFPRQAGPINKTQIHTWAGIRYACQILKFILKIWLKLENCDIIESERKNKARPKFDRKSQIFRPQYVYERWMYGQGVMSPIIRLRT